MAGEQQELKIIISADASQLIQQGKAAQKAIEDMVTTSSQAGGSQATARLEKVDEIIGKMVDTAGKAPKPLEKVDDALTNIGNSAKKGGQKFDDLTRGMARGIAGMGGLTSAATVAGVAIGAVLVGAFREGIRAMDEYDSVSRRISALTSDAANTMEMFTQANLSTYASTNAVAAVFTKMQRVKGTSMKDMLDNTEANADFMARLATYLEEQGANVEAVTSTLIDVGMGLGLKTGEEFKRMTGTMIKAASDAGISIGEMASQIDAKSIAMFKQYGYSIDDLMFSTSRLAKFGVDVKVIRQAMSKTLHDFARDDPKLAAEKWAAAIQTLKSGNMKEAYALGEQYGWRGDQTAQIAEAAKAGALTLGQNVGFQPGYINDVDMTTVTKYAKYVAKGLSNGLRVMLQYMFDQVVKAVSNDPRPTAEEVKRQLNNNNRLLYDEWVGLGSSYEVLQDILLQDKALMEEWGPLVRRMELPPYDEVQAVIQKYLKKNKLTPKYNPATTPKSSIDDWQIKSPIGVTVGMAPSSMPSSRGISGQGVQVASAFATDYSGTVAMQAMRESQEARMELQAKYTDRLILDSKRLVDKQKDNAGLTLEYYGDMYRKMTYASGNASSNIKYTWGDTMMTMRNYSDNAAKDTARSFYTLKTIFGDFKFDITDLQNVLTEWGISLPTILDNMAAGFKRIGKDILKDLGLEEAYDKMVGWVGKGVEIYKKYEKEVKLVWDAIVKGVYLSAEEAAKILEQINADALSKVMKLVGQTVTTISEMFATGKTNWRKLWKDTMKSLLNILIDWAVKSLATFAATQEGMLILTSIVNAALGDWKSFALAMAGIAAIATVIYGVTAAIEDIGNMLPDEDGNVAIGDHPAFKGIAKPSVDATPSYAGAQSLSITVDMGGANIYGSMDDRTARKIGEGFATGLSLRGVETLAYS